MKKLLLLLLLAASANSQTMGNAPIDPFWSGTWTTLDGSDTINVTTEKITWTSLYTELWSPVSYVDYYLHNDANYISFYAYPNVYVLSLEKISRNKIIFHAQTDEGLLRSNDIYLRAGTRTNYRELAGVAFLFCKIVVK